MSEDQRREALSLVDRIELAAFEQGSYGRANPRWDELERQIDDYRIMLVNLLTQVTR